MKDGEPCTSRGVSTVLEGVTPRPLTKGSMAWRFLPYELFTMQRYLQEEELERLNIHNFDAWAKTFGKVVTSLEVSVDGSGFQTRQRFNKFFNIPELMNSFREVAEIQTESMLNNALENSKLQRKKAIPPKHVGDKAKVVSIEPSPELEDYIANVV